MSGDGHQSNPEHDCAVAVHRSTVLDTATRLEIKIEGVSPEKRTYETPIPGE
jgi:hypothetical protein